MVEIGQDYMVSNQVSVQVRHEIMTWETSRTDRTKIYSNYIENKPQMPVTMKII